MAHQPHLLVSAMLLVSGCGASQPKQTSNEYTFDAPPPGTASALAAPTLSDKASLRQQGDTLTPDQKAQMEIALRRGGDKASQCVKVAADAKPGEGEVKVIFDGKKGKVTDVLVGPPWKGLPLVESCIKRAFVGEYVVPFEGELEVPYPVKLTAPSEPAPDAKDAKDIKDPKAAKTTKK